MINTSLKRNDSFKFKSISIYFIHIWFAFCVRVKIFVKAKTQRSMDLPLCALQDTALHVGTPSVANHTAVEKKSGGFHKWGTPKSSILIGFSRINHPFWGIPIHENPHLERPPWMKFFFLGNHGLNCHSFLQVYPRGNQSKHLSKWLRFTVSDLSTTLVGGLVAILYFPIQLGC